MGTIYRWNAGSGAYANQGNWLPTGVPGSDDNATIDAVGVVVTASNTSFVVGNLAAGSLSLANSATLDLSSSSSHVVVGNSAGSSGTLTVMSGAHLLDQAATTPDGIGEAASSQGSVSVSGPGSAWNTTGRLLVGVAGSGTLAISSGGFVSATPLGASNESAVSVGADTGSNGLLTVSGPGSTLSSTGRIGAGVSGTGTLEVLDGGTVTTSVPWDSNYYQIFAGGNNGGNGTIIVSGAGSVLNANGGQIGLGSVTSQTGPLSTGTLIVSAGASIAAGASVDLATTSALNLGGTSDTSGYFLLTDAGSTANLTGQLNVGNAGFGSATIQGGATLTAGDPTRQTGSGISIANSTGGSGSLLITGVGTKVTDTGRFAVGRNGNGTLVVSGGAFVSSTGNAASGAVSMSLGASPGASGFETVTDAGSVVSLSGGLAVGGGSSLVAGGGVAVTPGGAGQLTIANSGVVTVGGGATIFAAGTVSLAGGLFQTDSLDVESGSLSGAGTVTGAITGNGSITASGGTLDVTGSVASAGSLAIAAGSALALGSVAAAGINFTGPGASLVLGASASVTGAVNGFAVGDAIDVQGTSAASATYTGGSGGSGVLTVGNQTIALTGGYANLFFDTYSDGNGGTEVELSSVPGGQSASLPGLGSSIATGVASQILAELAALTPSGGTANVVTIAGGAFTPPAASGALNALVVNAVGSAATVTLPSGFEVGYLLAATTLQDTTGGAALIDSVAGGTLIGAAADTLFGGNAGATLFATTGAETLIGGTGSNAIFLGSSTANVTSQGNDTITGSTGAETVNASGTVLYFGTSGATDFIASGSGGGTLIGGNGGNTIAGGGGSQLIFGSSTLNYTGGAGAATIIGGGGGNSITGGAGNLLLFASSSLTFNGTSGAATIIGGGGAMNVTLGSGGGLVYGSPGGNDTLNSGPGAAILVGGGGGDVLNASGTANDLLVAGSGAETLNGAASSGNLVLFGGPGTDVLSGGTGNDLFIAESGNATLTGGGGTNSYVFVNTPGTTRTDLITDFNPNRDAIGLFGYGAEPAADQAALASATVSGTNTTVTLTDGTSITLVGVTALHSYNFF